MTDQELNEACARVLGWREMAWPDFRDGKWREVEGWRRPDGLDVTGVPNFSGDHDAVRLLEDEIERRDLGCEYAAALVAIADADAEQVAGDLWYATTSNFWALIRAKPEQKARAFLAAMKESS